MSEAVLYNDDVTMVHNVVLLEQF